MTLITYCIVSKKYTLNTYFLFSLKKHTLFLDFCCFWHPKHGPRGTCLSVKNNPFSVFLYSSMISTFEYKWPPRDWLRLLRVSLPGQAPGGGTDLERGYGDVRPWRPPFHASPAARKGPISSKRVSSQDPLLRKFGNFSLYSLNFHPNFSSQAPKFGNFQLTSPQIWKFSAHKPPNSEIFRSQAPLFRGKCQFASPTLRKSGPHTPTWKKVECPPPGVKQVFLVLNVIFL